MGNKKDKWSALSMSERADLIKLYVSNGITSLNDIKNNYNSFGEGGNTGGDTNNSTTPIERKPTLEEFLQAKADSTRNAAYKKSLERKQGIRIPYPLSDLDRQTNQKIIDDYIFDSISAYSPPRADEVEEFNSRPDNLQYRYSNFYQAYEENKNNCDYGFNCIGTTTSEYPEDSRTVSNKDFAKTYSEKGFKKTNIEEARPGDVVQVIGLDNEPTHAMMFSHRDGNLNKFNYSDGSISEENYKVGVSYPANYLVYTYEGTPELIQQWTAEYEDIYNKKYGGKLLTKRK